MECADSNASIENISRKRESAVDTKKFQNKSKNIGEVYPSEFFRCMWCYLNNTYKKMELSYYNSIFQ